MAITIAVAGKGGTGKTTFCGMLIDWMGKNGKGPILAVDADANSNLNEVLGVEVETTLGDVRELVAGAELALNSPIPVGMSKQDFMDMKLQDCIVEDDNFDLIVMGRTQGKGCYCFVNDLLQRELIKLQNNYPYMVCDNEAGMEHISRGILPSVDYIVLVSDCSRRGVQAVARIAELIKEVGMNPKKVCLVVNRAPNGQLNDGTMEEIQKYGLDLIGVIPQDETVYDYDCNGKATSTLPDDNGARKAVNDIAQKLFS
ncbi:MAG: AAA family ATPase [Bacillota bacterium]|nr:AAA family ATPase [Bacillota bacterium]